MSRRRKILLWTFGGLVALVLLLFLAAALVLQSAWFQNQVRRRIVAEIENATGGRAEVGQFDFSAGNLTATVRDLTLHGNEAPGEPPLFAAGRVEVALRIVSFWRKQIDLQAIEVDRPRVHIIVYPDGRTNVPKPKAARHARKGAIETVLDLAVKRFQITNGTVDFAERRLPLQVAGQDLTARIFYDASPPRYRGDISFRSLDVKAGAREPLPLQVEASLVLFSDRLDLRSLRLSLPNSRLDVNGAVEQFAAPRAKLSYTGTLDLRDITGGRALGPLEGRGRLALTGTLELGGSSGLATQGRLDAAGLVFREAGIYVSNFRVRSNFRYGGERLDFSGLGVEAASGRFDGSAQFVRWKEFVVDGAAAGFSLQEITRIPGIERVSWNGTVSGPVHIEGALTGPKLTGFRVRGDLAIAEAPGPNPVNGAVALTYDRASRTVAFGPSRLNTRFSRIEFSGVLGNRMDAAVDTTNLDDAEPAISMFTKGPPPAMPVRIEPGGSGRFRGTITGPLKSPVIQGHASLDHFVWGGRTFDHAEADTDVSPAGVEARNAIADRLGVHATGTMRVTFQDWHAGPQAPLQGAFAVRAPNLDSVLAAAKERNPLEASTGAIAAQVTLGGTIGAIEIGGTAQIQRAVFYGQPIDRITGSAQYTADRLEIPNAQLEIGPQKVQLSGRFDHPRDNWQVGRVRFQAATDGLGLDRLGALRDRISDLDGRIEGRMAGELTLAQTGFRVGACDGWFAIRRIRLGGNQLGSIEASAATQGGVVNTWLEGELAGAKLKGTSQWTLSDKYPARGRIDFSPLQFSTLLAHLGRKPTTPPSFEASASGSVVFSGSTLDPQSWRAELNLPAVEARPTGEAQLPAGQEIILRNDGPVILDLDRKGAQVRRAQFRARETDLKASGRIGFGARNAWNLRVQGGINLALLRDFDKRIYSAGSVALDVSVRGALARPEMYGRIDLRKASLNYGTLPNGIDNANGVIFVYRDRATIDSLTAETGGGKISITGFVAFDGSTTFHLRANATDVRVRYPEDISSTVNASLAFTGTLDRSVLSGDVTVMRVGFNPRSDLGSILARAAKPLSVPVKPSRFEQGMHFDVHMVTAPQVRFETQLTRDVQGDADLRLRGDWTRPILLGRLSINSGEVIFFGSRYTINTGQILFVNAVKIEPTLNLDLETRVRGIEVTLHLAGPIDRLNISYRSDPPLPFSDIVALVATGRAPTYGGQVGQQAQFGQSWEQAGATALVGQAITSPITGRLQRFFGVSRLKIDPVVTGMTTSNAAARLTVEQNITPNLTFTYITDLSRAQAQIISIEWDLTNNWSAVAVREENGLFGIDFQYRKQLK